MFRAGLRLKGTHAQGHWFRSKLITHQADTERGPPGRTRCNTCIHNVQHTTHQLVQTGTVDHSNFTASRAASPHQLNSTSAGCSPRCSPHGTPALLEDLDRRLRLVGRGGGEAAGDQPRLVMKLRPLRLFPRASPGPPHQTDIVPPPHTRARLTCGWAGTRRRRASLRNRRRSSCPGWRASRRPYSAFAGCARNEPT